jgi:hypothetical protein
VGRFWLCGVPLGARKVSAELAVVDFGRKDKARFTNDETDLVDFIDPA